MPKLAQDLLELILTYPFPEYDGIKIAELMSMHSLKSKKLPFQSIVAQSGIEHLVDEVLDPDSKRELVEDAAKYAKHIEALKVVAMRKAKAKAVPKKRKKCGTT